MKIKKIFVGGWFQRTTLHLSEIADFLNGQSSPLKLDPQKLNQFRENLDIKVIQMKIEALELIEIDTSQKINIKIFEDGLLF